MMGSWACDLGPTPGAIRRADISKTGLKWSQIIAIALIALYIVGFERYAML